MHILLRRALVLLVCSGAVTATGPAAFAATAPATAGPRTVTVTSPAGGGFTLSDDEHAAGLVAFHFVSRAPLDSHGQGGSDVEVFQPRNGVTDAQVISHIQDEAAGPSKAARDKAAAATRWLAANTTFHGGAAISGAGAADDVLSLGAGNYRVIDVQAVFTAKFVPGAPAPQVTPFHVRDTPGSTALPRIVGTIDTTTADRFRTTARSFGQGALLIRDTADTLHFVSFSPVREGTTDADIQARIDAITHGQQPPPDPYLHHKTAVQAGVLTGGQQQVFSSPLLTPGTYDLECFVADDVTGMPHFFMGMHKIVVIR